MWPLIASGGLSLIGSLLGKSENPTIDPEKLRILFGPGALAGDTQELFRLLLNSPAFASMMNSAGMQGARMQSGINANLARSGVGGPLAAFARQAGSGYGASLQRKGQEDLFLRALMEASGNLQNRAGIWANSQLRRQEQPTFGRMVGASMLNAGGAGLSSFLTPSSRTTALGQAPVLGPSLPASDEGTDWWSVVNQRPRGGAI